MSKSIYDHAEIEKKWAKKWQDERLYDVDLSASESKYYCLDMFPYPSGTGLHVGHWRGYVLSDFYARYARLHGKNVLHPMGYDSFGLPAERAAIKYKSHPKKFTDEAIENYTRQLKEVAASYDWTKELSTSDPKYYRWTQWLFLQLFKHDLAEKRVSLVNWCPNDQTVLANEQVVNGCCERCGAAVTKKELAQWFLKTTEFSQELLDGLNEVDWPDRVKLLQRDWIGRSEGASVKFTTEKGEVEVFTTRPDTLFGVTALVLSPEHPLVVELTTSDQKAEVEKYVKEVQSKTDIIRQQNWDKEKSAVFTGSYAKHPLTNEDIPVWIADYVLMSYGTGAVMSVPAHDERDYLFAKAYDLPITQVITGSEELPFVDDGKLINSGEYNDLDSKTGAEKITEKLKSIGKGEKKTTFRLRDWLVSRQRYWGAPIPIVYDPDGKPHAVKEEHLPLLLPEDVDFLPGGESPVARSAEYKERAEKLYGKGWYFDTDTLDTFVDSSWYFLRYLSPTDDTQAFNKELVSKWLPVDLYIGGIEHATGHLMYSRFITKFLAKFGYISKDINEPFKQLFNIGAITMHGAKMSKSKGNVVSPDLLIEHYGTDALRGFELFVGPMEVEAEWNNHGMNGIHRFLIKLNNIFLDSIGNYGKDDLGNEFSSYFGKVEEMAKNFRTNTIIAEYMKFLTILEAKKPSQKVLEDFLITLSPVYPFIAEELWEKMGHAESIFKASWPEVKEFKQIPELKVMVDQKFVVFLQTEETDEQKVVEMAKALPEVAKKLENKEIIKSIYRQGQLINFLVKG